MNTVYQRVSAVLERDGVSMKTRADVDAIFHGDETVGAQAAAAGGYDASLYPVNGSGMEAWIAAGRPQYDVAGRELSNTGFPTGNMKDGSSTGSAAAPNLVGGPPVTVVLQTTTDTRVVSYTAPAGRYWLEMGEQPDQNWVLSQQDGGIVASGNGSSDEAAPFSLSGPGTLHCSFNAAAVSQEQLDQRIAAGQGVSKMHYTLRPA